MKGKDGAYFCTTELDAVKNEKIEYIYYSINEFQKPQYERNPMSRVIKT
jgi:hypothetical protein